jgi:hypothetical protein
MSPRENAKNLHESCGMSYEDACNLAGYDPIGEAEIGPGVFLWVFFAVVCWVLLAFTVAS